MTSNSDQALLFGIIALQMDFVRRDQLVEATSAWLTNKSRTIEEILAEQGALSEADRQLLAPLVDRHLENHGGDPQQSLAALSSIGSVSDELRSLGDESIEATLSMVASDRSSNLHAETVLHESKASTAASTATLDATDSRFRVLRSHAKGGLGEVYIAKDTELNRDVALKEIQSKYADDEASRLRFLLEAEVTGGLEHPGIVPVYGLGRYEDGRPFYAMRFIKGDSLQEAVDRFHDQAGANGEVDAADHVDAGQRPDFNSLEFRKLLGRFIDVCQAIEYAHSRGVLHRDLKPGNIMLGKYGETLVVDWGLAKAQERNEESHVEGENTLRPASASGSAPTMMGSAIGTPAFMPPEQASGELERLGPASDVYSLGATLYHVLTGRPPFRGEKVTDVLECVKSGDFPPPDVARSGAPKPLAAICMRAMALEPNARYATAQQLADDVDRFLADEPTTAYREPPSVCARRWLRKHPRLVTGLAATLIVGLASATVVATVVSAKNEELDQKNGQLTVAYDLERKAKEEATDQRNRALAAELRAKENEDEAKTRMKETEAVLEFFKTHVLAAARPEELNGGLGINATIREAVDAAEPQIANAFQEQPIVEAVIRATLGDTYFQVSEPELAIAQLERALKLATKTAGPDDRMTIDITNSLSLALQHKGDLAEAIRLMKQNVERSQAVNGPTDASTLTYMNNLADAYYLAGKYKEGVALLEETLAQKRKVLGPDHAKTRRCMNSLAVAYEGAGDLGNAVVILEKCFAANQSKLGEDHPDTATTMANLGAVLYRAGKIDKSAMLLEKAVRIQTEKRGREHSLTLMAASNLATTYMATGKLNAAREIMEDSLKVLKVKRGAEHAETLMCMNNLSNVYMSIGEFDKALPLAEETLRVLRLTLGPKHRSTLIALNNLGSCYWELRQLERSIPILEEALELTAEALGDDHPDTINCRANLGINYRKAGRVEEALPLMERAVAQQTEIAGPHHPATLSRTRDLAETYLMVGESEKGLSAFDRYVDFYRKQETDDGRRYSGRLAQISLVLLRYEQAAKAESYLRECLKIRETQFPDHWLLENTKSMLGGAMTMQRKFSEAEPLLIEGYRRLKIHEEGIPARARVRIVEALERLVDLYNAWEKPEEVAKWRTELQKKKVERK